MKTNNTFHIIALLSILALASCLSEPIEREKNEEQVSFVINVAEGRAIVGGSDADNAMSRIDVLLFDIGNNNRFVGRVTPIAEKDQTSFVVTVREGRHYSFVVLANAKHIVDAVANRLVVGSTTQAAAYALLTESLPGTASTGVWNAQPGSEGYKDFPMWGEMPVNTANEIKSVDVTLVRMLAKINLSFVNQTVSDKLEITEVYLCNYTSQGLLASRYWNWDTPALSMPDASTNTKRVGYENRLIYSGNAIRNNAIIDEILLFEVAPPPNPMLPSVNDQVASTCLIVKGFYNGATVPSYYRIDIRNANGYLGITRNHAYEIVIQDVTGSGANTGEIAYNSETVNIVATVREWEMGYQVDIDYDDGHYQLIVSESEFTFDMSGNPEQVLRIFSNHQGGWKIEKEEKYSWINVSLEKGGVGFEDISISCKSIANGSSRTGEFYITTALLRKKIVVVQRG